MAEDTTTNFANAAPLGLLAFGLTTILLSLANADTNGSIFSVDSTIMGTIFLYGGLAEILAGIFCWRRGELFTSIVFISYGFFWLILNGMLTSGFDNQVAGVFFLLWGFITAFLLFGTLSGSLTHKLLFGTLTLTFLFLAIRSFTSGDISNIMSIIAGIFGVISGATGMYSALATVANDQLGEDKFPL